MNIIPKTILAIALLVAPLGGVLAQGAQPARPKAVTVNVLAKNPKGYLGSVVVLDTVATVTQKKGFLLVDSKEYKECGLSCLSEAGTKKVPVKWSDAAPKAESAVKVTGVLKQSDNVLEFVAIKVERA